METNTPTDKSSEASLEEQVAYWKREALGDYAESPDVVRLLFAKGQALGKAKELLREMMTETEALAWDCVSNEVKNPTQVKGRLKKDLIPKIEELMTVISKPHEEILRVGDIVVPKEGQLRSGGSGYPWAIIISLDPFIMVDETADMKWSATFEEKDVMKRGHATPQQLKLCLRRLDDE